MDLEYIEPFITATTGVFRDMFKEEPEYLNPYLLDRKNPGEWDISGVIGIAGDTKGAVVVSLSAELSALLTSRLVGHAVTPDDPDVVDAVGEVVNIIAGNAKKGLEQFRLSISLPSIVRGKDHSVAWQSEIPIIGIPFKVPSGRFHLSVGLEKIITS
jgi:chemotaxis protein CheX